MIAFSQLLSKSVLEAASIGMPIVSSDIDASKDLVIENENGFLVPVKNAFDLANAIEKLVLDEDLRNIFGQRSRNIVLKQFSEEVVCKKTLEFYNQVAL